jgi:RNA polymerase sigma factor (sigma-70 family)
VNAWAVRAGLGGGPCAQLPEGQRFGGRRSHPDGMDKPRRPVLLAGVGDRERDPWKALLDRALAGEREAVARLIDELSVVIQARSVRVMGRLVGIGRRNLRQEVEDLTQEIFAHLFAERGRVLRSWDAERGLSLPNFVGLIAERHIYSLFRVDKRRPFREEATEAAAFERRGGGDPGPEQALSSRQQLDRLLDRMRETLTPLGARIFQLAYVEERDVPEVARLCGLTEEAVYVWRSRLRKTAGELLAELEPAPASAEVLP